MNTSRKKMKIKKKQKSCLIFLFSSISSFLQYKRLSYKEIFLQKLQVHNLKVFLFFQYDNEQYYDAYMLISQFFVDFHHISNNNITFF